MARIKVAVIGVGKIAQDQHLPVIAGNSNFELVGVVSQRGVSAKGVPTFPTAAALYAAAAVDAVAICTPPHVRHAIAREALAAGKHVMLEKPPAATIAEMRDLDEAARAAKRVIFATWHSHYNAAVDEAKARLAGQRLKRLAIEWKEDVRRWHPGQDWIWDAGNFGVFDPGINALSILTKIAPAAMFVKSAKLVLSREPRHADRRLARVLDARRVAERRAERRVRLAPGRRPELEHRHRNRGRRDVASDPRRFSAIRRRQTGGRSADAGIRRHLRAFRRVVAKRRKRHGRKPVPVGWRRLPRRLAPDGRAVSLVSVEIHGYAIVSADDHIADATGAMPASLRNDADWAYFQAELDRADWVAIGRLSHEATPNPRGRRRLIVSGHADGVERREDGVWWRPATAPFEDVATQLMPDGGRLAVPGGQGVFELFLGVGYTAFHLARAETVKLPGGRGLFSSTENGEPADATLQRFGLKAGATRWLDEAARVSLTVYRPT